MKYIAILTGKGEGCDYTTGCNRTTIEVSGETLEEDGTVGMRQENDHRERYRAWWMQNSYESGN